MPTFLHNMHHTCYSRNVDCNWKPTGLVDFLWDRTGLASTNSITEMWTVSSHLKYKDKTTQRNKHLQPTLPVNSWIQTLT